MYILNYIFSFFTTSAASIKACLTSSRESEEATPLVSERHLSAQFEQFEDSTSAVHAALWHTFFYYLVTVILFSFVVEDFSIIDSLYFASTVVRDAETVENASANDFSTQSVRLLVPVHHGRVRRYESNQ